MDYVKSVELLLIVRVNHHEQVFQSRRWSFLQSADACVEISQCEVVAILANSNGTYLLAM